MNSYIWYTIAVYGFSSAFASLIMHKHDEYRNNVVDDSLSFDDQEFSINMMIFCPILNTILVLSFTWFFLKWLFKVK